MATPIHLSPLEESPASFSPEYPRERSASFFKAEFERIKRETPWSLELNVLYPFIYLQESILAGADLALDVSSASSSSTDDAVLSENESPEVQAKEEPEEEAFEAPDIPKIPLTCPVCQLPFTSTVHLHNHQRYFIILFDQDKLNY